MAPSRTHYSIGKDKPVTGLFPTLQLSVGKQVCENSAQQRNRTLELGDFSSGLLTIASEPHDLDNTHYNDTGSVL